MAQQVQRIEKEFVFSNLIEREAPVEVHTQRTRIATVMTAADRHTIRLAKLHPDIHDIGEQQPANVYFRFRGKPMTFRTRVIEENEYAVIVKQPEVVYRELSRGFERIVHPEGISVSLMVQGEHVSLRYPTSEMYEPVEPPSYDAGFDATKVADLMRAFRERGQELASEGKIIMFRERNPQTLPERLIAQSGRLLVLPLQADRWPNLAAAVRNRLLTQDDIVRIQKDSGKELFTALDELRKWTRGLQDRGVHHELYCPILYNEYVVGYLYLVRAGTNTAAFPARALEFCVAFARILAYSLQVNGYFKGETGPVKYDASQLIDISGSGLLFSSPVDGPELGLYSDVDLQIRLEDHELSARGRVMRKFKDQRFAYFGVQFVSISNQDMETLFDRLYGSRYRGDIDDQGLAEAQDPDHELFG